MIDWDKVPTEAQISYEDDPTRLVEWGYYLSNFKHLKYSYEIGVVWWKWQRIRDRLIDDFRYPLDNVLRSILIKNIE